MLCGGVGCANPMFLGGRIGAGSRKTIENRRLCDMRVLVVEEEEFGGGKIYCSMSDALIL